jgi:hypothetical protein
MEDMYLVGWWLDGVAKSAMSPRFQVTMDESHVVAAVYAKPSVYQSILQSIKKRLADNIEDVAKTIVEEAKQLAPDEHIVDITIDLDLTAMGAIETYKGWALFAKNSEYFSGTPSFVLAYAFDVTQLGIDASKCVTQQDECDMKSIEEDLLDLAETNFVVGADLLLAYVICGVVLGVPTAGAGAVLCPVATSLIVLAVQQVKIGDKSIFEHLRGGVDRLTDLIVGGICKLVEWILRRAVCASAGSDVELLVTDPDGHRVGGALENNQRTTYKDIPGSWYSGLGSHPQYVVIPSPGAGSYRFTVTGMGAGSYELRAISIVDGSAVATQQYSGTIGQGETQELSAQFAAGGSIENLRVISWWERYQPWLVYGALAVIAVSVIAVYASRSRRKGQRRSGLEPEISDVTSSPRIVEVTSGPKILEIKDEE